MVPALLAAAGALVITRRVESRSIYSGRVHAARVLAALGRDALPAEQATISAAAHYPELLHAVLAHGEQPLRVLEENGAMLGEVSRDSVVHPDPALVPLEAAAAADFAKRSSGSLKTAPGEQGKARPRH